MVFAPAAAQTFSQNISGNGSVVVNGPSSLLFNGTSNAYTGGTNLNAGTLSFVSGALGSGAIAFNGGTLQWAVGNTQDVSSLIGAAGIANSNQTACLNTNGNNVTFKNAMSGSGGLTKLGGGSLVIAASQGY